MDFDRQSLSSINSNISRQSTFEKPGSDIKKTGYLKKLKTGKRKFFVLRSTSASGPARLEYYDQEKKFKRGTPPNKSIELHDCFNINKSSDTRQGHHGIEIFLSNDCLTVLAQTEEDQKDWLDLMLEFQNQYLADADTHREHYEYVWQVTLLPKGLGQAMKSKCLYRLCLNSNTVSLTKASETKPQHTIQLVTIRKVSHQDFRIRLEVGKVAPTGEGEFHFTVEDSNIAKDMHSILLQYMSSVNNQTIRKDFSGNFRKRSESHSSMSPGGQRPVKVELTTRPVSYYPPPTTTSWHSIEANSPSSPIFPPEQILGNHRPRSNTAESRSSRASSHSHHEDAAADFVGSYNGENLDIAFNKDERPLSMVPPDMQAPLSPGRLDDEISDYLEMSKGVSIPTPPSSLTSSTYLAMNLSQHSSTSKGDHGSPMGSVASSGAGGGSYMSMSPLMGTPPSFATAPIPIHAHSYSEPHHSTLPTVREGGSNEGCLPMDLSNSPASTTGVLRPEPSTCLLSDDNSTLPPRTYSLGSRPVKKNCGYVEMAPKGSSGQDISRATSAPHIIYHMKGRREQGMDSPTTSVSPLSTSMKSDDSDSFMEYMPMRPRTASDSFNYNRHRTSSFGKMQPVSRPRSSSHGQGQRPISKLGKLSGAERSRLSQDPIQRVSRESSLQGSFDSLRVSSESLRRQQSGSNASDFADARNTPSPKLKVAKEGDAGYVSMQLGINRRSSPHRVRTDSTGSGRRSDSNSTSVEKLQNNLGDNYALMSPLNISGVADGCGDFYMNMDFGSRSNSFSSDKSGISLPGSVPSKPPVDALYMNMSTRQGNGESGRSVSLENVDSTYVVYDPSRSTNKTAHNSDSTYVVYDPAHGSNKPRTGSLGSKDKRPKAVSARKGSSASTSSVTTSNQPSVSSSTRKGGSSDSLRKASRQSSMEKAGGSLGKDFRKKSGSTGSRPNTNRGNQNFQAALIPVRKLPSSAQNQREDMSDEYVEFDPTATIETPAQHHQAISTAANRAHAESGSSLSSSARIQQHHHQHLQRSTSSSAKEEDNAYTLFSPRAPSSSVTFPSAATITPPFQLKPPSNSVQMNRSSAPHGSKQVIAKDDAEYVGFEPAKRTSSSASSLHQAKHVEAKDAPEYVGFEPRATARTTDQSEYVGFHPGQPASQHVSSVKPEGVHSYIQTNLAPKVDATTKVQEDRKAKPKQKLPQQHTSLDSALSVTRSNSSSVNSSIPISKSLTLDTSSAPDRKSGYLHSSKNINPPKKNNHASALASQSNMPPVPPLPALPTTKAVTSPTPQPTVSDNSEYVCYSPAGNSDYMSYNPASPSSSRNITPSCLLKENTAPGSFPPAKVTSMKTVDNNSSSTSVDNSEGSTFVPSSKNSSLSQKSGVHKKSSNPLVQCKEQQLSRQLSAPSVINPSSSQSDLASQSAPQSPIPSLSSPLNSSQPASLNPLILENQGQRLNQTNNSIQDMWQPSSLLATSRHKHNSGPSSFSQKANRKLSSDLEKPLRKGSKSDSNSSLTSNSGKGKRRSGSGDKSPLGSAEKSPLSPSRGNQEFFGSDSVLTSSKDLEAKMIPVESKIRHSLGDMTAVVGVVNKEGQNHGGLCRPGSTPCMQMLDSQPESVSDSTGNLPTSQHRTGVTLLASGSRSRHSISDLGIYQQVNMSSGSPSASIASSTGSGDAVFTTRGGSNSSGSADSCGSSINDDTQPKPLNYVKLDMSCADASSEASRSKSRHASDADERPPPVLYAEIDHFKSQNLNKALGHTHENSSSKS